MIIILLSFSTQKTKANHILGADISWKALTNDTFEFTVSVYRSCGGIALSNSPFTYSGATSGCTTPKTVYGTLSYSQDITPAVFSCNPCTNSKCTSGFGIQLYTEKVKIKFPPGCCDWFVSWQQSSRDGAITTGPAGQNFYLEAELNTCLSKPDNSPFFNTLAQNVYCLYTCLLVNNSASDIDTSSTGKPDSLVYNLVPPLTGHNTFVTYSKGYAYDAPVSYDQTSFATCPGFHLDPLLGWLFFRIQKQDISVCAIRIDELKPVGNGNYYKMGSVMRDFEIVSIGCPGNHSPIITGINGGTSNSIKICSDQQTCFTIRAFDIDPQDTVTMNWDSALASSSATFIVKKDGKKWPTGTFCWRPSQSQVRAAPYQFTIHGNDNHSPAPNGDASRAFRIYVIPTPEATYSAADLGCGKFLFNANPANSSNISDYAWLNAEPPGYNPGNILLGHKQSFTYQFTQPGVFHYVLVVTSSDGCSKQYHDSVNILVPAAKMIKDTIVCEKSPGIILDPAYAGGKPPYFYHWNTGEYTPQKSAIIKSDTSFSVEIKDVNGCKNTDTIHVHFRKAGQLNTKVQIYTCSGELTTLKSTIANDVIWKKITGSGAINNFSKENPLYTRDTGLYIAEAKNSATCPGADSFVVHAYHKLNNHPVDSDLCLGASFVIRTDDSLNGKIWVDTGTYSSIVTGSGQYNGIASSLKEYKFFYLTPFPAGSGFCIDTVRKNIRVHAMQKLHFDRIPDQCASGSPFSLDYYEDLSHHGGTWYYPPKNFAIVGNYFYPKYFAAKDSLPVSIYVHYIYTDPYHCTSDDSVKITVFQKPDAGPDAIVYKECGPYNLGRKQVPHVEGLWTAVGMTPASAIKYSGDSAYFFPDNLQAGLRYPVLFSYKSGIIPSSCDGTDTAYLLVEPKPLLTIPGPDTICGQERFVLTAYPSGGNWKFLDTSNPAAITFSGGQYFLSPSKISPGCHQLQYRINYGDSANPCTDSALKNIYVLKEPDADFYTPDSTLTFCANADSVPLTRVNPGSSGIFSGMGVVIHGAKAWFKPGALGDSTYALVNYSIPYHNGTCIASVTKKFRVTKPPVIHFAIDSSMCLDDTVFHLKAFIKNASSFQWKCIYHGQDGGLFIYRKDSDSIATVDFIPDPGQLKDKRFTISITAFGTGYCDTVQKKITIAIKAGPQPDFVSKREGCDPFTTVFKNNSYDSSGKIIKYQWDFGDRTGLTYATNPTHIYRNNNIDSVDIYNVSLKVYSDDGCSRTIKKKGWMIVHGQPRPVIKAIPAFTTLDRPTIFFGLSNQSKNCDTTDSATRYEWHFGDRNNPDSGGHSVLKNPEYTYSDTGFYTVVLKVTNANGCIGIDSEINLIDIRPAFAIFIPNVFLPGTLKGGGTHINKIFKPVVSSCSSFRMTIYNRWGELMFETSNPENGWDGTYKGNTIPEGVYIYNIEAHNLRGEAFKYNGTVSVIK